MAAETGAAADAEVATGRLLDYYLHTTLAAGRHYDTPSQHRPPAAAERPASAVGHAGFTAATRRDADLVSLTRRTQLSLTGLPPAVRWSRAYAGAVAGRCGDGRAFAR
jgi:hypothetical protein